MSIDAAWDFYLSARGAALRIHADADGAAVAIERERARVNTHFDMMDADATITARRSFLYTADAAFHDQLLASGRIDVLRAAVESIVADIALPKGGALAISLHYGPATALLPLWIAAASARGLIPEFGVIENSRRNPSVMLSPARHAALARNGFPLSDLDIATLGECGALRRALAILRRGGIVLIFADGQLPPPDARRGLVCRLGRRELRLPEGAQWLAQAAGVPLLPLLVRPQGDSHRIVGLPLEAPCNAPLAMQALIDAAMAGDPAPWWRWTCSADHL